MMMMMIVGVRSNRELPSISTSSTSVSQLPGGHLRLCVWKRNVGEGFSDHSHYCGSEVMTDSHSVARLCCSLAQSQTQTLHLKAINVESLCRAGSSSGSRMATLLASSRPRLCQSSAWENFKGHMGSKDSRSPFRDQVFGIFMPTFSSHAAGGDRYSSPVVRVTFFTLSSSGLLFGFSRCWLAIFTHFSV